MIIATIAIVAGCGEKIPEITTEEKVYGEWRCQPSSFEGEIYASFAEDGSFELFQKIGEGRHRLYRGSWSIADGIISGQYNDGTAWSSTYLITFAGDNQDSMTWTSTISNEVNTYVRGSIPEEVRNNCVVEVKGGSL